MANQPDKIMECPICLDPMRAPIIQCERGHNMCGDCVSDNKVQKCPTCRGKLTKVRSYQLEQLIESVQKHMKMGCCNGSRGCKFILSAEDKSAHELECKYRIFKCEASRFAKLNCNWTGTLDEMFKHFEESHYNQKMTFKTEAEMKINLTNNYVDVQMIPFFNGAQYFFYKHKVDVDAKKVYWVFQLIGSKCQAEHYYYEFEIYRGRLRKYKVTEICENDITPTEDIFKRGKCVVVPFEVIENFMDEKEEIQFKFRLMSLKKENKN
ncbi:E3 ubiquitin-protein ligase sina isoform X1 [Aethina tumida]|uniref:E3 ubiquitin-protein ligase sina isoform X1 n=2 Tax=Aethina tumida TaxID=116153 RepID=UPI00096AF972|nr:E3 ubiquitin-protein ligase sina isoform X1 [Aethina tumida]